VSVLQAVVLVVFVVMVVAFDLARDGGK